MLLFNICYFLFYVLWRKGGGHLFTAWSKQGMENIFIEKIDKVVEQPIM